MYAVRLSEKSESGLRNREFGSLAIPLCDRKEVLNPRSGWQDSPVRDHGEKATTGMESP